MGAVRAVRLGSPSAATASGRSRTSRSRLFGSHPFLATGSSFVSAPSVYATRRLNIGFNCPVRLLSAQGRPSSFAKGSPAATAHSQTACRCIVSQPGRTLSLGKNAGAASGWQQSLGEIGKEHSLEARGSAGTGHLPVGTGYPCLYAICLSYSTLFPASKSGNRNCSARAENATEFTENSVAPVSRIRGNIGTNPVLAAGCLPLTQALRKMSRPRGFVTGQCLIMRLSTGHENSSRESFPCTPCRPSVTWR